MQKISLHEEIAVSYNEATEPFIGVYISISPSLLLRDPKLIKDIFIKDFQYFDHNGLTANVNVDPMANNMFLQRGEKWKRLRTQFSPAFLTSKLKGMFETIVDCGKSLDKYISCIANTNKSIEMLEVFARFATNVIASVAFGINVDCIENPDCEFRKYGRKAMEPTFKNSIRSKSFLMAPKLAHFLGVRLPDKEVSDFMIQTVKQNLEYREKNNVTRKDIFQLLMQLRNTGK